MCSFLNCTRCSLLNESSKIYYVNKIIYCKTMKGRKYKIVYGRKVSSWNVRIRRLTNLSAYVYKLIILFWTYLFDLNVKLITNKNESRCVFLLDPVDIIPSSQTLKFVFMISVLT